MAELRSKNEVWLVDGLATDSFPDNKLPTREEVLKVLEWHSRRNPRDLQGVVRKTSLMLQVVWGRANIPMIDPTHLLKKVRQLRGDYSSLKKSRSRESAKELEKRESIKAGLKQLFDVAHRDAMSLMTIQEDKEFLEFQRKPGRQGKMARVDEKEGRRVKRKLEEEGRAEREKESRDKRTTSAVLEDSTSSSSADPSPSASPAKRTLPGRRRLLPQTLRPLWTGARSASAAPCWRWSRSQPSWAQTWNNSASVKARYTAIDDSIAKGERWRFEGRSRQQSPSLCTGMES